MDAFRIYFDGPLPFVETVCLQEELVAARVAGSIPDVVLFLEHTPVITLGMRAAVSHVLLSPEELAMRSIPMVRTSRGGDVTWHGPGQLVMYPIIKLGYRDEDAHGYLHNLEEIALRTAGDFGVSAFRRKGMTGAWTARGKLAAIGIRLKRWVTFHGMSFNVDTVSAGFDAIVPCGLSGERVTSLRELLDGACPSAGRVRERMSAHFGSVCRRKLRRFVATDQPRSELTRILSTHAARTGEN